MALYEIIERHLAISGPAIERQPQRILIIVDDSGSTSATWNGRTILQHEIARLKDICADIARIGMSITICVLNSSYNANIVVTEKDMMLIKHHPNLALNTVRSNGGTPTLNRLATLLSMNPEHIHIITDGQHDPLSNPADLKYRITKYLKDNNAELYIHVCTDLKPQMDTTESLMRGAGYDIYKILGQCTGMYVCNPDNPTTYREVISKATSSNFMKYNIGPNIWPFTSAILNDIAKLPAPLSPDESIQIVSAMASLFANVGNTRPIAQYLFTPSVMQNIQVDDVDLLFNYVFDNTISSGHSIRVIATDERKRRIAAGVALFDKWGPLLDARSAIGLPYYHNNTLYCIIANTRPNMANNAIQFIGNDADRQATRIALRALSGITPQTDPIAVFYAISKLLMAYMDGLELNTDYAKALFKLVECQFGMTIDNRTMLQILIQGVAQYYKSIDYRIQLKSMPTSEIWMGFMALMEYFGYKNIFNMHLPVYDFVMTANKIETYMDALSFLKKTYGTPMPIVMKNECSYSSLQRRIVYNRIYISSCCNVTADHQFSGMCYCGKAFNWSLTDTDNCDEIIHQFTKTAVASTSATQVASTPVASTVMNSIANIATTAISSIVSMVTGPEGGPTSAITVDYIKRGSGDFIAFTMQGNIGCGKNYVTTRLEAHMQKLGYNTHVFEPDRCRGDKGRRKVQIRDFTTFVQGFGKKCIIFNMCNTGGVISTQFNGVVINPDTIIVIRPAFSRDLVSYQHYCLSNVLRRPNVITPDYWLDGSNPSKVYEISAAKMTEFFNTYRQYATTIVYRVDHTIADRYRSMINSFDLDAEIARIL